eukprot:6259387-Pyramimonas_sp.AAC.1
MPHEVGGDHGAAGPVGHTQGEGEGCGPARAGGDDRRSRAHYRPLAALQAAAHCTGTAHRT